MQHHTRHLPAVLALAICAVFCAGVSEAASARYNYLGTTEFCDDAAIGGGICGVLISLGDEIGGFATLSAPDLTNATLGAANVVDYGVGLEDVGATPDNSVLELVSAILTDSAGNIVGGAVSLLVDPLLLPVSINVNMDAGSWDIVVFPGLADFLIAGGSGAFGAPQAVPLPAGLYLLATALAGLGVRLRRPPARA